MGGGFLLVDYSKSAVADLRKSANWEDFCQQITVKLDGQISGICNLGRGEFLPADLTKSVGADLRKSANFRVGILASRFQ